MVWCILLSAKPFMLHISFVELNAGLVGLGLTYVISLADMLQYTIRLSADVENTVRSGNNINIAIVEV